MPSQTGKPRSGEICVFGDSHLGAVKRAWDGKMIDTDGRQLRFWGADGPSFRALRWRRGRIRPDSEVIDLVLRISGGLESLGPEDFESYIFYGARLRAHEFFRAVLQHESRPEGHISSAQMQALLTRWLESIRAWRLAREFARAGARVVFVPTAFPTAGILEAEMERERLAVPSSAAQRARLWGLLCEAARENGFVLLAQPDDSVTDCTLTRREYAAPNAVESGDWVHKSPQYGARMVQEAIAALAGEAPGAARMVAAQ